MLELEMAHDHVHLLIDVGPILSLPQTMQFLKGVSARRVFERFPELKLDLGHDHFWQRGYGFRHVNRGAARAIATYIRNHRNHDDLEPRTSVRGVAFPETNGGPHD
jgi:putative transposase